jgi:pyruvate dehydrogenase E2 component (dihydrolipoamide acetyltransferase)
MAYEFRLPDVGEGLTEATVVRWLKEVGDPVAIDEVVVEVETDKAIVEMPAPVGGVILHQGAATGETLEVGQVLVVIGEPGETWRPEPAPVQAAAPAGRPVRREAAPIVGTLEEAEGGPGVRALPAVRKLAAQLGVDLAGVAGSGPGGRVTREDVEAAAAGPEAGVERVRLSATRLAIARNLSRSWREIPHVTTYGEADAHPLLEARRRLAAATGASLPLEALLIRTVTPLLARFPEFNASVEGETLLLRKHYDVGVAVDTPDGLMVAVVRGADGLDFEALGAEVSRLAAGARERTLGPADLRGATFTISNIGAVGGRFGTPIIPPGTTAILSVGRADERPVVRRGAVTVGREFPLSLSYDHRVIDGALGRRFLGALIDALESW